MARNLIQQLWDQPMTLDEAIGMVRTFHRQIQAPIAEAPHLMPGHPSKTLVAAVLVGRLAKQLTRESDGETDLVLCRAAMTLEELAEWLRAHAQQDLTAAADAIGDRLYLLLGDAVASGLPLAEIFRSVHDSNMTKMSGVRTGIGKAVKGRSFRRPEIDAILVRATARLQ
jgi:predicted HAD superfamily Cof-like phosphohydrolase